MSITELWREKVNNGELFKLEFLVPGPSEKRVVLLSPEIHKLISGPWTSEIQAERCNRLRADLENILSGERLVVCWEPFKARKDHQIGRLAPVSDNVFDLRSGDPSPGLRVLFHFAKKDVLVVHLCSPRSVDVSWIERLPLISRKRWNRAIQSCHASWSILFPHHDPHSGNHIDDYLSNAIILE
jgi:hypothetical protein